LSGQQAASCIVTGVVKAGAVPLPGVSVDAATADAAGPATSTGPSGTYRLALASPDFSLAKDIALGGDRGVNVRLQAADLLNTPRFSVIDTVVNSPTFGRVIGVLPMRSVQIVTRLRF
jgi:hypothetical protein